MKKAFLLGCKNAFFVNLENASSASEMNWMAVCGERRLVDDFRHGRMGVDRRMDFLAREFLIQSKSHFRDEFRGVFTNDVSA